MGRQRRVNTEDAEKRKARGRSELRPYKLGRGHPSFVRASLKVAVTKIWYAVAHETYIFD